MNNIIYILHSHSQLYYIILQLVSDYSEVEMKRRVGGDGMATEEYNFNSEVAIEHQVYFCVVSNYHMSLFTY